MDDTLRYIQAIVENGNLTRAAESLFISQPALSRYLGRVEQSLGVQLIDRNSRPLTLTVEGQRYHEYLVSARSLRTALENDLADMSQISAETVRLGATSWRSAFLLPRVIPRVLQDRPNLQISVFGLSNADLMSRVRSKSLDLAVMSSVHAGIGVHFHEVAREELIIAGASLKEAPFLAGESPTGQLITVAQSKSLLQNQRLILMNSDHSIGAIIRDFLTTIGLTPRRAISSNSVASCVEYAARSAGITFAPIQSVLRTGSPRVPYLRLHQSGLSQAVGLAWPADTKPTGASEVLAEALTEQILTDHSAWSAQ